MAFMIDYKEKQPSKSLYNRQFAELRGKDYQPIFDKYADYSISTINKIKKLFNQMYKTAIEVAIVDRNYSSNIIMKGKETEKGVPFSGDELKILWQHRQDKRMQPALILIYCDYIV